MRTTLLILFTAYFLGEYSEPSASHGSDSLGILFLVNCGYLSEQHEKKATNMIQRLKDDDPELSKQLGTSPISSLFSPAKRERFKNAPTDQLEEFRINCEKIYESYEEVLKPLDTRFSSPEATWNTFVSALKRGDKKTIIESLSGEARKRLESQLLKRPVKELNRVGQLYLGIHLWEDEYADDLGHQQATSIKSNGKNGHVIFQRIGKNWKITTI